ncbi:collagen alpha-1(XII) chain-like [Boleophthalmus pectinirostris]|uniref:collagen alpha-1(XII) chain-like n=1 Tax=Boleophthalmus pectinirostris TaxID=150288 RepID=UPI00242E33A1|nr:collagen alpha-1(XII) chain-like [Boleophthalmus pectinirostris]
MDSGRLVFVLLLCCSGTWAQITQNPQTECSLSEDHRADVLLLLDGFNHISSEDFSKVKDFLVALVQILGVVGLDSVQIALVKCGGKPEIEFYLNTYHDLPSVVSAVRKISQSPASPGDLTTDAVESVVETIFHTDQGAIFSVPSALIVISDRNSSGINRNTVERFRGQNAKLFIVGVKGADYSELKDIGMGLDKTEVYTVKDFSGFPNTLRDLTQSFCRWIKQKLDLPKPESLSFFDVQPRRARVSWTFSDSELWMFLLETKPHTKVVAVPGYLRTAELLHLKPNTSYQIFITAMLSGVSMSVTRHLTTQPDSVRLSGGPGRCSGSLEVHTDQLWSSVCAEGFGQTEAEIICRELDCGGVSDLQGALITEGSVVGRSFHCSGAEAALKDCESSETLCSAAANITCTDDDTLWLDELHCRGVLHLRHQDEWRPVTTSGLSGGWTLSV